MYISRVPFLFRQPASGGALSARGIYSYKQVSNPHIIDSTANMTKTYATPSSWIGSRMLTVTDVEQINHDTKRLTFSLPGGATESSGVPSSGAILTQHTPKGAWLPVLRPYTPVHDRELNGILQLVVKKYDKGVASTHMHSLNVGDKLKTRGPIAGYTWTTSKTPRNVVFIAGGTGITPLYSLTKGVLTDKNDKTHIHLLWGVNGTQDIIFKQELETMQQQFPDRLSVTYAVSNPDSSTYPDDDKTYRKGQINKDLLIEVVDKYSGHKKRPFGDEKGTKVWLCGTPKMEEALAGKRGVLGELQVTKKMIHRF